MQQQTQSSDPVREFVIAGHGNLDKVKQMLHEHPEYLNVAYQWGEKDTETAIQAAAQVGNAPIAEFLLGEGAPLEICTAAMLGRDSEVKRRLDENPTSAKATGAHGIPLLPHAVWSGNARLVELVYNRGATAGVNLALHNGIVRGNPEVVRWLLENAKPSIAAKNYQGKTPLSVASELKSTEIVQLLKQHGATE
ncbi:MAG TPA: ankyrin repeat domain-containing protein [Candidatus Dormibacteraeota bacterium]|jgi:ankyrin repeat protein|nr:ankyrin repeat domain-containing protein [Candidatus Dormibacteraeota bacterium]